MEKKKCAKCNEEKSVYEFYKNSSSKDKLTSWCRKCLNSDEKHRRKNNREKYLAYQRKNKLSINKRNRNYYFKNKEKILCSRKQKSPSEHKKANLRIRYGLSIEKYEEMKNSQGGVCAICQRPPGKKDLHVDHDHETGKIRELLCSNCNTILGQAHDDISLLESLIVYLQKHNA